MKSHRRCPYCEKVREVIVEGNKYLCKHCGQVHHEIKHSLNRLLV